MILGIDEADMLNPQKVKIIDGIAGAGKSSKLDTFFKSHGIPYLRTTSTNQLARAAAARYPGTECRTICSALFDNREGFYHDEKDPEIHTIVIDEILQTTPAVYAWIRHHRGAYNIIVTTDSQQMLNE